MFEASRELAEIERQTRPARTCSECGTVYETADLASACCTWQGGGTPTERAAEERIARASEDPGGYIAEAKRDDAADAGRWEAYVALTTSDTPAKRRAMGRILR